MKAVIAIFICIFLCTISYSGYFAGGGGGATEGTDVLSTGELSGLVLTSDGADGASWAASAGTGDVSGPASSVDGEIALFSGVTGKLLKNTGAGSIDGIDVVGPTSGPAGTVNIGTANSTATGTESLTIGRGAGDSATTMFDVVIIGDGAGENLTTSARLVIIGEGSGNLATTQLSDSTIVGARAGRNSLGSGAAFFGHLAGFVNETANNTMLGTSAGLDHETGEVTLVGYLAGAGNLLAAANAKTSVTFIGARAGQRAEGDFSVYVGNDAGAMNSSNLNTVTSAVGIGTKVMDNDSTPMSGDNLIAIGRQAGDGITSASNGLLFGRGSQLTTASGTTGEVVFGSAAQPYLNFYLGEGGSSATPNSSVAIQPTQAVGTDISNTGDLTIAGGQGSGTGTGSSVLIKTAPAGLTGTAVNALVTRVELFDTGGMEVSTFVAEAEQVVAMVGDDQAVTATHSTIRVTSDDATSTNRTMDLQNGTVNGQRLDIISDTPTNAWELQDTGNQCLTALFTPADNDMISLKWNSTTACWHEAR